MVGLNAFLGIRGRRAIVGVASFLFIGALCTPAGARDLMPQKKQEVTQFGELDIPPLDQENWRRPQGMFKWIAMACGWEVPEDNLGRPGWHGNPTISPKVPAVSVFPLDTRAIYIVYEIPPLDAPMQMNADWFSLDEQGRATGKPIGADAQFLDMNEAYGFFEVFSPEAGWNTGDYLVKIYISSPGQQVHALSQVGTMQFTINQSEEAVLTGQKCEEAGPPTDLLESEAY